MSSAVPERTVVHAALEHVFGLVYLLLMTNLLLVMAAAPFAGLLVATDPARTWPLLAVAAVAATPALTAAFAVFDAFSRHGSTTVVRTFCRTWRVHLRRSATLGAVAVGVVTVLIVDCAALWGSAVGAVVIPVLAMASLLALVAAALAAVAVVQAPHARLRDVLRGCVYLAVRRWYVSAVTLLGVGVLAALMETRPALALGLAASPVLYLVWANSCHALVPLLEALEPAA